MQKRLIQPGVSETISREIDYDCALRVSDCAVRVTRRAKTQSEARNTEQVPRNSHRETRDLNHVSHFVSFLTPARPQ